MNKENGMGGSVMSTDNQSAQSDGFNGDDAKLCACIDALLALDANDALPHRLAGHARTMLAAAASRLRAALAQAPAPSGEPVPPILFDGFTVLQALTPKARARTSAENVADVLDAVVGLLRAPKGASK